MPRISCLIRYAALVLLVSANEDVSFGGYVVYTWTGNIEKNEHVSDDPWQIGEGKAFEAKFTIDNSQALNHSMALYPWEVLQVKIGNETPLYEVKEEDLTPYLVFWGWVVYDYANAVPSVYYNFTVWAPLKLNLNGHAEYIDLRAALPGEAFDPSLTALPPPVFDPIRLDGMLETSNSNSLYYFRGGVDGLLTATVIPEPNSFLFVSTFLTMCRLLCRNTI